MNKLQHVEQENTLFRCYVCEGKKCESSDLAMTVSL